MPAIRSWTFHFTLNFGVLAAIEKTTNIRRNNGQGALTIVAIDRRFSMSRYDDACACCSILRVRMSRIYSELVFFFLDPPSDVLRITHYLTVFATR